MSFKFLLFFLSVILATKCVLSSDDEQERSKQVITRIINAKKAELKQFKYVVFIQNNAANKKVRNTGWVCTGAILTPVWVITALHCYTGFERKDIPLSKVDTVVRAGTIDRGVWTPETQDRTAINYVKQSPDPANKLPALFNNNIILVQCNKPFIFNEYVSAITGIRAPFPNGARVTCFMIGFGRYYAPGDAGRGSLNTELHYASADVDGDPASCEKRAKQSGFGYAGNWTEMQICAKPTDDAQAPCDGDSGSPLICGGFLAGTESGRLNKNAKVPAKCGTYGNYHVYMSVSAAEQWIRKTIPNLPRFVPFTAKRSHARFGRTDARGRSSKSDSNDVHQRTVANCILFTVFILVV